MSVEAKWVRNGTRMNVKMTWSDGTSRISLSAADVMDIVRYADRNRKRHGRDFVMPAWYDDVIRYYDRERKRVACMLNRPLRAGF